MECSLVFDNVESSGKFLKFDFWKYKCYLICYDHFPVSQSRGSGG